MQTKNSSWLFKRKAIQIAAFMCAAGLTSQAWSQVATSTSAPSDYGQKIGDVVVSASRAGTELRDMTQNTSIITQEDLQNSPSSTVDQVLKNESSVFLNDQPYYEKDPTGQSLNVRGLGAARTLVLIDGVPANDAMYGTIQWNLVPMSSIQDVELIRGGVSSLYGNMGMGGVVNITTRPIEANKGEFSASYGTDATGSIALSKEVAVGDGLKLRISGDYFSTEGYQNVANIYPAKPNTSTGIMPGMGPESAQSANYRLQGDFKLSQDTSGFFNFGIHSMQNLPTGGYNFAAKTTNEDTLSVGTTTLLGNGQKVQVNAYYENTTLQQQNVTAATVNASTGVVSQSPYMSATYHDPYNTLGASAQYTNDLKDLPIDQAIFSVDGRQVSASNLTNLFNAQSTTSSMPGTLKGIDYAQGQQEFYGVMGQIKSKLDAIPLQATLSARVDQWESQIPTYYGYNPSGSGQTVTQNVPNQSATKFSPNLGLLYQATQELDFRVAAYQGFHAPGLNNQIRSYGSGASYSASNPNLTPENMTGYEAGIDYRWGSGFIQITGFNANVTNAIYAATMSSAQVAQYCGTGSTALCTGGTLYGNNQSLQSRGLEFQSHYDLTQRWATDSTFTHTNTVLTYFGGPASQAAVNPLGSQIAGTPQNMGYIGVTYALTSKTNITGNVRWVGNSWYDGAHTLPIPSYAVVGLRANYEMTNNVSLYVSGVNLLNRNYITYNSGTQYLAGQPQTVMVGARMIF